MLDYGYFPTVLTKDGRLLMWEHVSWSKKFPGVLTEIFRKVEAEC